PPGRAGAGHAAEGLPPIGCGAAPCHHPGDRRRQVRYALRRMRQAILRYRTIVEISTRPAGGDGCSAVTTRNPTLFVGRTEEFARISERLDAAHRGDGGVLLIAGEPGIGKTRLAEEAARLARERGFRALWGRCYEDGGAPAYWPWIQALRAWLREVGPALAAGDASVDALVLAQLLPELAEGETPAAAPEVSPESARFRLFDALTALRRRVAAGQPLLIVLDDVQWADAASLGLLRFLAPELAGVPLLVICTYRTADGGAGPTTTQAGALLARLPRTER